MIRIPEYLERRAGRWTRRGAAAPVAASSSPSGAERPLDACRARSTVLFAPDSFKGSLTSVEVARALADGWARARPDDELLLSPLADGGEGTLVAIEAAGGWEWRTAAAPRPDRPADRRRAGSARPTARGRSSSWPRRPGCRGSTAAERDPLGASTRGTGEVLRAALDAGVRSITLGHRRQRDDRRRRGHPRALGARLDDGRRRRPGRARPAARRGRPPDRLRRHEPAARASGRGRDLRAPEGRDARAGRASSTPARPLRRRAWRRATRPARARDARRRRGRRHGFGAALPRGPVPLARARARRRARHGRRPTSTASSPGPTSSITGEGRIDAQTAFGKTALGVARRARRGRRARASPSAAA